MDGPTLVPAAPQQVPAGSMPLPPSFNTANAPTSTLSTAPGNGGAAQPRSGGSAGKKILLGVVIALVVVVGVLVALVATGTVHWFDGGASSPNTTSSGTATKQSGNQGSASKSKDKAKPAKTCDAAPDMTVSSIKSESDNLIVTILATSNCDDKNASTKFNDSATRLTLQDSDDNVVADAVFDFSGDNAKTISGDTGTKIKVSYASSQYYRPANEIGANPSDLSVKSVTGSDKGAAASSDSGVISGSNVTDDEAENNASKALDWQVEHDKDSAELFYSTYTAQLSSKRKGMEAEGKTWNYRDILAQFITMHNKNSNVLLIWSGDWPAYSSNSDKYYVILAGEGFDSTDEAWNWCKANNYGPNDCMPIDLQ